MACYDANKIVTQCMRELSSNTKLRSATVVANRTHDLVLDYIKESTQGLSKMSINRIKRASIEKEEWDALKAFEDVASEQQKIYAKAYCKPALKSYEKKKKNFDVIAAHISYDIAPKIIPRYDFNLPVDINSQTSEQAQENKEEIQKLSRDFRLKATELYLKIAKEESEFQNEKLETLLKDFPQDKEDEPPSTRTDGLGSNEEEEFQPLTQRPLSSQNRGGSVTQKGSGLYTKYIEISLKRTLLETEREVLFLAEKRVQETPFVMQEAQQLTPALRKDFVLQA